MPFIDLTGQKFNRLTVIKKDEEKSKQHKRPYWLCKCDCGKEKIIAGISLKNGATKSCGCLRNERVFESVAKDEVGRKYGKLTVIDMDIERDKHGRVKWFCECECGNIKSISGADLRSGNTQSCGCLTGTSRGEQKIIDILEENKVSYVREYQPTPLKGKRFDFAILDSNNQITRLIEFDGEQHFKESKWGRDKLDRTKESDSIKNLYALSQNIPLTRIPYWELNNLNYDMLLSTKYEIKGE